MSINGLQPLGSHYWPDLWKLMLRQDFPDVPETFEACLPRFKHAHLYGVFGENGHLKIGFAVVLSEAQAGCLDVVVAPDLLGRWAHKGMIRKLYQLLFVELALRYVWVEPNNKTAQRACLQAGFIPVAGVDKSATLLVLTPRLAARKFGTWLTETEKEEENDGLSI